MYPGDTVDDGCKIQVVPYQNLFYVRKTADTEFAKLVRKALDLQVGLEV